MSATTANSPVIDVSAERRLPVLALVSLALIGFILVAMETMPAGLLPDIAAGMATSEGTVGLFVSAYALGTVIVTVPAISLTRRFRRKPLLLISVTGLILANAVTAISPDVAMSLVSRFIAGSFSGVIWACWPPTPSASARPPAQGSRCRSCRSAPRLDSRSEPPWAHSSAD